MPCLKEMNTPPRAWSTYCNWNHISIVNVVIRKPRSVLCFTFCCPRANKQVLCNGGGLDHIPDNLPPTVEHLSLTKVKT